MSNGIKNRQERLGGQDRRTKARESFEIRKRDSILLSTIPNLYKLCTDGAAYFEAIRSQVVPQTEKGQYTSLAGQQLAQVNAAATLDDVLAVLIRERSDHKWSCDVVVDGPGGSFVKGTRESEPCATREEAESHALPILSGIGQPSEAHPDYEDEAEPDR